MIDDLFEGKNGKSVAYSAHSRSNQSNQDWDDVFVIGAF
jgi:hypothetical protein